MRATALLLVLLLVGLLAGAAWWLLGEDASWEGTAEDDPFAEPAPDLVEPPPTPEPPGMVVTPVEPPKAPVAVLDPGEDVPAAEPAAEAMERLHEERLGGDTSGLDGASLLQAVGRRVPVRLRRAADRRALEALGVDPDWPPGDDLPLIEVVEHWRRAGFEVELRGSVLLVTRPDE